MQRVYAVQPAMEELQKAGIPVFPRGLHHRTLLQFLGPYVPVTLLVPVERVEDAERIVRARLAPGLEPQAEPKPTIAVVDPPAKA